MTSLVSNFTQRDSKFPSVHFTNFSIAFPGPPDPPRNCTLSNQTHDSLQVDCQEGFGSGLNQEFHMEVFSELQLLVNITARSPRWVVFNLFVIIGMVVHT